MSLKSMAEVVHTTGVGASDIAAVLGISPYRKPWDVYAEALGLVEREPSDAMRCGLKFQRAIAEMFSEDVGLAHEWWDRPYFHPQREWQRATVDAFIPTIAKPEASLEVKLVASYYAGDWDKTEGEMGSVDQVPDYYVAQVLYQLAAHDLPAGYIAACIGGVEMRYYLIERDLEIEEFLLDQAEEFWRKHILARVEPPPGRSDEFRRYFRRTYPRETEALREATEKEIALLTEYADVRASLKPFEERKEELENELRQAVKDAEGLSWPWGRFTYKKAKGQVNWKRLAERQLMGYTSAEKEAFCQEFAEPGSRRIYFKDLRREAA